MDTFVIGKKNRGKELSAYVQGLKHISEYQEALFQHCNIRKVLVDSKHC